MGQHTALFSVHQALDAKICPFAGYDMPLYYPLGSIKEHNWVRESAGLFDVSHMGQAFLRGPGVAELLSTLTPSSFLKTPANRAKYTVLTTKEGGVIDDLIITRVDEETFFLVLNAGRKEVDMAWIKEHMTPEQSLEYLEDRALLALQGPKAEEVLIEKTGIAGLADLPYMTWMRTDKDYFISRLGYTGEDGFEISVPADEAVNFFNSLQEDVRVEPIGLSARDSLRLEMGYPLYGHDIDETTSPIEADLSWVVGKTHNGFHGEEKILKQREEGTARKRISFKLRERGIAREGAALLSPEGKEVGKITSGGFSPSLNGAIGQGYVATEFAEEGTELAVDIRGKMIPVDVTSLSILPPNTKTQKRKAS